jgi:hypothetical protein
MIPSLNVYVARRRQQPSAHDLPSLARFPSLHEQTFHL